MNFLNRFFLTAVVILLCAISFVDAQSKAFNAMEVLPERTLVAARIDMGALRAAGENANLQKLIKDKEMMRFFEPILEKFRPQIEKEIAQFEREAGLPIETLLNVFSGELLVATVDFIPSDKKIPFGVVIALNSKGKDKDVQTLLDKAFEEERIQFETANFKGTTIHQVKGISCSYAAIDGTYLFASHKYLIEQLLLAHLGESKEKFLKERIDEVKKYIVLEGETPLVSLYVDVKNIYSSFGVMIPPQAVKSIEDIGAKDISSVAFSFNSVQGEFSTNFIVNVPHRKRGIHKLYEMGSCSPEALAAHVPSHSTMFVAGRFDLNSLLNAVEEILNLVDPHEQMGLFKQYSQILQSIEQGLGFKIKDDLGEAFEPEYTGALLYPEGSALLPEWLEIYTAKDQAKAQKCIDALIKVSAFEVKKLEHKSRTIFYLTNPIGKPGTDPFRRIRRTRDEMEAIQLLVFNFMPGIAYAWDGNHFYFGRSAHCLMDYFDWKDAKGENLASVKDFQAAAQRSPDSMFFLYIDPRPCIYKIWNTGLSLARSLEGTARSAGIPLETALLPRSKKVASAFTPEVVSISAQADGLVVRSRGSICLGSLSFVGLAGGSIGIAQVVEQKMKAAKRQQAYMEIRQLSMAVEMYRMNHGSYPPSGDGYSDTALVQYLGQEKKPYFDFSAKRLDGQKFLDPWGRPYFYRDLSKHSQKSFTGDPETEILKVGSFQIYSKGPDPNRKWNWITNYR